MGQSGAWLSLFNAIKRSMKKDMKKEKKMIAKVVKIWEYTGLDRQG